MRRALTSTKLCGLRGRFHADEVDGQIGGCLQLSDLVLAENTSKVAKKNQGDRMILVQISQGGLRTVVKIERGHSALVQQFLQLLGLRRVLKLFQALLFNLANAFPRYLEAASHLFQSVRLTVRKAKSHEDHIAFPLCERA